MNEISCSDYIWSSEISKSIFATVAHAALIASVYAYCWATLAPINLWIVLATAGYILIGLGLWIWMIASPTCYERFARSDETLKQHGSSFQRYSIQLKFKIYTYWCYPRATFWYFTIPILLIRAISAVVYNKLFSRFCTAKIHEAL